jgi:hypothetical protein
MNIVDAWEKRCTILATLLYRAEQSKTICKLGRWVSYT